MTEEFLKALAVVPESVHVITNALGKEYALEIAELKEEALEPSARALVRTMEAKGYKLSSLLEALAMSLNPAYPKREEVVQCLFESADCVRKVEAATNAPAREEDLKTTVCALLKTLEDRAYQILNFMNAFATCVHEAYPERKNELNCLEKAESNLIDIEERDLEKWADFRRRDCLC